jgi:hypothetical protein
MTCEDPCPKPWHYVGGVHTAGFVHRNAPTRPHPFEPSGESLRSGGRLERCDWCGLVQRDTRWHPTADEQQVCPVCHEPSCSGACMSQEMRLAGE